jgi:hypothetical protein
MWGTGTNTIKSMCGINIITGWKNSNDELPRGWIMAAPSIGDSVPSVPAAGQLVNHLQDQRKRRHRNIYLARTVGTVTLMDNAIYIDGPGVAS